MTFVTLQTVKCQMDWTACAPSYVLFFVGLLSLPMLLGLSKLIQTARLSRFFSYCSPEHPMSPIGNLLARNFQTGQFGQSCGLEKGGAPYLIKTFRTTIAICRRLLRQHRRSLDTTSDACRCTVGALKSKRCTQDSAFLTYHRIPRALGLLSFVLAEVYLLLLTGIRSFLFLFFQQAPALIRQSYHRSRIGITTWLCQFHSYRPLSWRSIFRAFARLCLYKRIPLADYNRHASDVQTLMEAWPK